MLAENCCYSDMHLAWKEQIDAGELGKIIYAEAEYIHDCRGMMRACRWDIDMASQDAANSVLHTQLGTATFFDGRPVRIGDRVKSRL